MLLPPMKRATNGLAGRECTASGVPICCTRPSCITTRRSASAIASVWSCVTMIVVMPPRCCRMRISRAISWRRCGVEVGQRFVEQQHARMDRQRAGQCDALLLTAGQLARQPRWRTPPASPGAASRPRAPAWRPAPCAASPARTRCCAQRTGAGTAHSSGTRCPSRADAAAARRCWRRRGGCRRRWAARSPRSCAASWSCRSRRDRAARSVRRGARRGLTASTAVCAPNCLLRLSSVSAAAVIAPPGPAGRTDPAPAAAPPPRRSAPPRRRRPAGRCGTPGIAAPRPAAW